MFYCYWVVSKYRTMILACIPKWSWWKDDLLRDVIHKHRHDSEITSGTRPGKARTKELDRDAISSYQKQQPQWFRSHWLDLLFISNLRASLPYVDHRMSAISPTAPCRRRSRRRVNNFHIFSTRICWAWSSSASHEWKILLTYGGDSIHDLSS